MNAETNNNPYESPVEVDDWESVAEPGHIGWLWRPNQPGKVACFWILGWIAFHAFGTLCVSGSEAAMAAVPEFAVFVFVAIGLYLSFEMLRKLTILACVMWLVFTVVLIGMAVTLSTTSRFWVNGPELIFNEASIFGTTVVVSTPYMIGIMAFLAIAPGYLVSILWGRRCNGRRIGPGIFSSRRNGGISRESHHGKRF